MLDYDPVKNLNHYPGISMAKYGKNPNGDNLYRIVFASSRLHLIYGTWSDASTGARYVPRYRALGDIWILERWLPPFEYAKMTRERWDREMTILGPWPDRGEYDLCHEFELSGPVDANIEKLVSWIEEGRKRRFVEHQDACRAEYDQETKDIENMQEAAFKDKQSAFGSNALVGFGGGRGTKTQRDFVAPPAALPQSGGKLMAGRRGPRYRVPQNSAPRSVNV